MKTHSIRRETALHGSNAAAHVWNGTSTIHRNDSNPRAGTVPALGAAADSKHGGMSTRARPGRDMAREIRLIETSAEMLVF